MTITSIVYFVVTRSTWKWPLSRSLPLVALFLAIDLAFLSASFLEIRDGGWVQAGLYFKLPPDQVVEIGVQIGL